jgi:hypothetical protein
VSWRYYQPNLGAGLWNGPDALTHIRNGPGYANMHTVLICMNTHSMHFLLLLRRRFHREVIFAASAFGSTG